MAPQKQTPLDETFWVDPHWLMHNGGLHSNTVPYYFGASTFFDPTSNNAIVYNQAMNNQAYEKHVSSREAFETRLREMSGLEYMVTEAPADMNPGQGTGVWVIRKQTRRKRVDGADDELTIHQTYFTVGDGHIYQAPTLADILNANIACTASSISKMFPAVDEIQKWTPAQGHVYQTPAPTAAAASRSRAMESKETTPLPDGLGRAAAATVGHDNMADPEVRLAEESFSVHMKYGGEFMDDNPITGKPGEFHLSSTGRKDKLSVPQAGKPGATTPTAKTPAETSPLAKDVKQDKGSKTTPGKLKRRKSKAGTTTPS